MNKVDNVKGGDKAAPRQYPAVSSSHCFLLFLFRHVRLPVDVKSTWQDDSHSVPIRHIILDFLRARPYQGRLTACCRTHGFRPS